MTEESSSFMSPGMKYQILLNNRHITSMQILRLDIFSIMEKKGIDI